jgi:hypothetical protein
MCQPVTLVGPQTLSDSQFRREFITTVRTTVRVLEPLLDTLIPKDMLALWKTNRILNLAFRVTDTEFVVTDDAS